MGFEPTRAEHIGLAVQRLNHSATSSHRRGDGGGENVEAWRRQDDVKKCTEVCVREGVLKGQANMWRTVVLRVCVCMCWTPRDYANVFFFLSSCLVLGGDLDNNNDLNDDDNVMKNDADDDNNNDDENNDDSGGEDHDDDNSDDDDIDDIDNNGKKNVPFTRTGDWTPDL